MIRSRDDVVANSSKRHTSHMQPQREHAYDFDFSNMELIPLEVFKMIFVQMLHVTPHITYQQMYLAELVRVAQTITYARQKNIGHDEFDWAEFLLEVNTFDEFIRIMYTEYYGCDTE